MKFLTIGSDPELFLEKEGKIVSAIGMVGGTKRKPKPLGDGFFVQEDNVLVEYNTPPCKSLESFVSSIADGQRRVTDLLPEGYKLRVKTSNIMAPEDLKHKKARTFGCDPDRNAWTLEEQVAAPPDDGLRTAGGHVYVGYENPTEANNIRIARALDIFLGVPSVLIDDDNVRRSMYGKAGSFRHKPFGLEYRTLSSFWIAEPALVEWVYNNVQTALDFVASGEVNNITDVDATKIQTAINESNTILALEIIERYGK